MGVSSTFSLPLLGEDARLYMLFPILHRCAGCSQPPKLPLSPNLLNEASSLNPTESHCLLNTNHCLFLQEGTEMPESWVQLCLSSFFLKVKSQDSTHSKSCKAMQSAEVHPLLSSGEGDWNAGRLSPSPLSLSFLVERSQNCTASLSLAAPG